MPADEEGGFALVSQQRAHGVEVDLGVRVAARLLVGDDVAHREGAAARVEPRDAPEAAVAGRGAVAKLDHWNLSWLLAVVHVIVGPGHVGGYHHGGVYGCG